MPTAERAGGRHPDPGQATGARIALVAAGVAYALLAASTTPFTRSANIVTAVPIVVLAVLVVVGWPLRARPLKLDPEDAPHPWRAWVVLFAAIVAWELADYAARGSRADHPTLSSMLDAVDRFFVLKAFVFFLWLSLGAAIVRRGRGPRRGPEAQQPRRAGSEAP